MFAKDKMFIVASNIDDSIKSVTPVYDISIIPDFLKFEEFINNTPISINTIVISERELPFTSANMARLMELLTAPFLKLTGSCIYLISNETPKDVVLSFLSDNKITTIVAYQGDLSSRFIMDIVSGAARIADEAETEVITYRMRASEYHMQQNIKRYETDEDMYITDEEDLSQIPSIEEPIVSVPSIDVQSSTYYVVGKPSVERTLFTFIEAQYLSLTGKTIIVESDIDYHRLTDIAMRSDAKFEYIDIPEFIKNPKEFINFIRTSGSSLFVFGCKDRYHYDYNFLFDILTSNLTGWVDYLIKECNFDQTPYGQYYNIVCADNMPDILECCNSLAYDIDEGRCIMVGVRTSAQSDMNISSIEMTEVVRIVLEKPNLDAQVVEIPGINLKGDEVVYDVLSVITRGNERQGRWV